MGCGGSVVEISSFTPPPPRPSPPHDQHPGSREEPFVILPTGLSLDDLEPTVLLAHEMIKKGIPRTRIAFVLCRVGDSEAEIAEAREYIAQAGYTVLPGAIPEKIAYRRASDEGRTLTETRFPTLNERGDQLAQAIADRITARQKMEVA